MLDGLSRVRDIASAEGYTLYLSADGREHFSREKGIGPLLSLVGTDGWQGACAADTVVGKAAAMLYVLLGVKAVYAGVLSKGAQDVFDRYGIAYAYGTLTDSIINRMGTGLCPMELAVKDLDDPAAAPAALREKLKQLSNNR